MTDDVPQLDGVHHLKLPVSDIDRSCAWYETRLGYRVSKEFVEDGRVMGVGMTHPAGGPGLALRLDPAKAAAAAGFDYFSIGVPTRAGLESLAARLAKLGETNASVHAASTGWILPGIHDPDGHEVRFYTTEQHTPQLKAVDRIDGDAYEESARREAAYLAQQRTDSGRHDASGRLPG
jgi:catechol 2,3-dioxygenase-like lactoylglutathione lyase family enzyme